MKLITRTFVLTAAQVNALETAQNLIPAPSNDDTLILVQDVTYAKLSGTATGTCATAPVSLVYTGTPSVDIIAFASAAATQTFISTGATEEDYLTVTQRPAVAGVNFTMAQAKGKGVDIVADGAAIAAFDGTLQVTINFYMMNLEFE